MWHDARRNEKAVYAVINERQKRALKRSQKYQAVRADPAEHLQLHGRSYRVHADAQLAQQAHRHALRPWGPDKVLIDRFDARAHLDSVPSRSSSAGAAGGGDGDMPPDARDKLEAMLCYERYRVLVANEFMKMPEERFLKQIYYEENLGKAYNPKTKPSRAHIKAEADKKKQSASTKTAIGFNYDQAGSELDDAAQLQQGDAQATGGKEQGHEDDKESDEEIVDDTWDMPLNARQLSSEQSWQLNRLALDYDIPSGQFINLLWQDREDQDKMKELKCIEEARALLVGPAAKRERALLKESKVLLMGSKNVADPAGASTTLLSFLNKDKPQFGSGPSARLPSRRSASDSDDSASRGGANEGAIQYISSFGADEQPEADDDEEGGGGGHPPQGPALPPQQYRRMLALRRRKGSSSPTGKSAIQPSPRRQNSRSRSRSASGRSRSRGTRRRGSRRTPSRSRSRSRSRSPGRRRDRRRAGRHRRSTSPKRGSARERRRRSSSSASPPSIIRDSSPPASPAHLPSGSIGHWLPLSSGRAGGAESPPASHVSLLSERSSLSDDQLEQRQVENRRRRVRAAKFNLRVKQCGQTVARQRDAPQPPSTTTTTTTPSEPSVGAAKLREKMRLKTARAFKRTLAKERDTQLLKYEEVMKERRQRDDELRQLDRQRRARERDTSPAAAPARRKDKRSGDNSPPAQHKDSPPL